MNVAFIAIVALLGAAPAAAEPASPSAASEPQSSRPLVIAVSGLSIADLRSALALRLPDRELVDASAPRPATTDFIDVAAAEDGTISYTLITAEGSAYDRTLPAEADRVRALASAIANLTFAIEAGMIAPDRVDVPQPLPEPKPEPAPEPEPEPEPEPPPPIASRPVSRPTPEPPPPPVVWDVGPSIDGGAIVAIAPTTDAGAFAAGFGRIGVDARHRRGALITAGVRIGGHARRSLALVRARIDVGGGWAWRWRRFELVTAGVITLEPWWVRDDGEAATLRLGTADASRRPLLGAALRVAPGVRIDLGRDRSMRIGPRIELAGSFVPQDGARTVDIARATDTRSALSLGGLELALGIDVTLWFGVRRRTQ